MTDAFAGGGVVKLSTDQLRNFASGNLQDFLDGVTDNSGFKSIKNFATGLPGNATPGVGSDGTYDQLLTGNAKGGMKEAIDLQQAFLTLAQTIQKGVGDLKTKAEDMQERLKDIGMVVTNVDDDANVTASEFTNDIS